MTNKPTPTIRSFIQHALFHPVAAILLGIDYQRLKLRFVALSLHVTLDQVDQADLHRLIHRYWQ